MVNRYREANILNALIPQFEIHNPKSLLVPYSQSLNLFRIVLGDCTAKTFAAHRGEILEAYHHSQRHNFLVFIWF